MSVLNENNSTKTQKNAVHFYVLGAIILELLIIIGAIIYTRLNSGSFVPSGDQNYTSYPNIEISDSIQSMTGLTSLNADSNADKIGVTYASLKLNEIINSTGQYIDPEHQYMAYSFYLKNAGSTTVSIDFYMRLTEIHYWMDQYIRILVIEDDRDNRMYQKPDQPDENDNMPIYNQLPLGIDFLSSTTIFRDTFDDFKPGEVKSFRIIIWLEEQDPDINVYQQSCSIESEIIFTAMGEYPVSINGVQLLSNKNIWLPFTSTCVVQLGIYYQKDDIS